MAYLKKLDIRAFQFIYRPIDLLAMGYIKSMERVCKKFTDTNVTINNQNRWNIMGIIKKLDKGSNVTEQKNQDF